MEQEVLKLKKRCLAELNSQFNCYQAIAKSVAEQLHLQDYETLRTSVVLIELQREGLRLQEIEQAIFAPRPLSGLQGLPKMLTIPALQKRFMTPFLRALRGGETLAEVARKLNLSTLSTYHHWELGRRDIPFVYFLQAIELLSGRLQAFLEVLPIFVDSKPFSAKPELYREFFGQPWIPSIFMALRLEKLKDLKSTYRQADYLSRFLNISLQDSEEALDLLFRLSLVRLENGRFVADPRQLYAIPTISKEKIDLIHEHWFSQAPNFLRRPGFHKVEQHATTHESKERIIQWVSELREKIRAEVKQSGAPETFIHINWQIVELM